MNLKTLIILISSVVLAVLAAFAFIYYSDAIKPESENNISLDTEEPKEESPLIKEEPIEEEKEYKETFIAKDDFELILPVGWQEAIAPEDFLFMAADFSEIITNEKAIEVNFRTNFSVKKDDLTKYSEEYSPKTYAESVKISLMQTIPGIEFTYDEQTTVNNRQAYFVECESTADGIGYKTLLVFIKTEDNAMWAISFNTFSDSWQNYRDQFYQITQSFKQQYEQ